jgi:hypothetical protein
VRVSSQASGCAGEGFAPGLSPLLFPIPMPPSPPSSQQQCSLLGRMAPKAFGGPPGAECALQMADTDLQGIRAGTGGRRRPWTWTLRSTCPLSLCRLRLRYLLSWPPAIVLGPPVSECPCECWRFRARTQNVSGIFPRPLRWAWLTLLVERSRTDLESRSC